MLKFVGDLDSDSLATLQIEMMAQAFKHSIQCDDIADVVNSKVDDVRDLLSMLGLMYDDKFKIVRCV